MVGESYSYLVQASTINNEVGIDSCHWNPLFLLITITIANRNHNAPRRFLVGWDLIIVTVIKGYRDRRNNRLAGATGDVDVASISKGVIEFRLACYYEANDDEICDVVILINILHNTFRRQINIQE